MKTKKAKYLLLLLTIMFINISVHPNAFSKETKKNKTTILTILKQLPKELFTIYTDVEHPDYDIEAFIETLDIKNAFISLGFGDEACTLCYWNLKDGRKLVALNRSS